MKRTLVTTVGFLFVASAAIADQVAISEQVRLGDFNSTNNTFRAMVQLGAQVCPSDATYSQQLDAGNVKSIDEARDHVKAQVKQITDALQREHDHCGAH